MTTTVTPRAAQQTIRRLARDGAKREGEQRIVDTLAALPPKERGELVRLLDSGGRYDTAHLLASDIDDPALRRRAAALIAAARPYADAPGRVVISDIDATVKPSRDPDARGPVYPGARALYRALDIGADGTDTVGDVHFVSARDGVVRKADKTLAATGIDYSSVSYGTQPGTLLASTFRMMSLVEERKVHNVKTLLEKNPTRTAILVGDTRQADAAVYRRILDDHPERVEVVLLHELEEYPAPADMRARPEVIVFEDFADCAQQLHARGALSDAQLATVLADVRAGR